MKKFILIVIGLLLLLPLRCWAAIPVVEHYTSNDSLGNNVNSLILTEPDSVALGDLLLIIVGNDADTSGSTFNTINGWTRFVNEGSISADCNLACYWFIADGSEGNVTVTMTIVDEVWGFYLRISGVDTDTPINATGSIYEVASASTHVITEVETGVNDCLAFYALAFDGADTSFTVAGTGWIETAEEHSGAGSADASGCWGTKEQATAGGTGAATVTSTATNGAIAVQFAVAPGEAPSGPLIGAIMIVD